MGKCGIGAGLSMLLTGHLNWYLGVGWPLAQLPWGFRIHGVGLVEEHQGGGWQEDLQ